jgi:Cd2+/Zn2+-exporting ATPase
MMTEEADATEQVNVGGQAQESSVRLTVPEMDCPSCAGKVTKSVEKLDGIQDLDPQITTGTLTATFDSEATDEDAIIERVQKAGYSVEQPPQKQTSRFSIPEMDCPSCAGKVENALEKTEGITEIDLQPTTGTARVTYDTDRVSKHDLVEAIERAGYEVVDSAADESGTAPASVAEPTAIWTNSRAIKTWIGAGFLALGLIVEFLFPVQNIGIAEFLWYDLAVADVLFLAGIVSSGVPIVRSGYYSARNLSLDMDLLMGTAIVAATGIGYFVEAATIAVLFSIAELLENYAMDRARNSLRELMELSPDEATVLRDGEEQTVPVEEIQVDEIVVVRPGEKISMDGVVVDGSSAVDESPITGESVPVDKSEGDDVYAGTINQEGYLELEVTSEAADNTLSRIIEMVQGAQQQKTDREQFVDRFAGYYTPTVVALALLTTIVPPLFLGGAWNVWFVRGLALLVIACPCAFVISTPVSVVSGVTSAAKNGVLVKGGNHLESMGEVDAIALDKTGTLTKGELSVTDIVPLNGHTEEELLAYASGLEQRSEHPIAEAILSHAEKRDVPAREVLDFESITGKGVQAEIEETTYYAGKPDLFAELGTDLSHTHTATDGGVVEAADQQCERDDCVNLAERTIPELQDAGKTVIVVGTDSMILGAIAIADEIRPEAKQAIKRLHDLGVERTVMLTGDNEGTAHAIAEEVGVHEYRAELLPEQKVEAIDDLFDEYGTVAMVGDGINDAPALATATVGVVMGAAGTDTALETADIALMGDDLSKLPYLYALSKEANGVIRQNIWVSLGVEILLAIGVPLGYVSIAVAVVLGDMGLSLGVTGNALRLSRLRPERFFDTE